MTPTFVNGEILKLHCFNVPNNQGLEMLQELYVPKGR